MALGTPIRSERLAHVAAPLTGTVWLARPSAVVFAAGALTLFLQMLFIARRRLA